MTLDRLAGIDPRTWLERLGVDPPHRVLARAVRVARQANLLGAAGDPLAMAGVVLRQGLGVRSMHAIHAAASPGRPAILDRHRQLDYAELETEIDAAARALHEDGARRGEPVGLMMENRSEYVALWMALGRLGIASAHLSPSSTAAELAPLLERAGIRRILVSEATHPTVERVAAEHPELQLRPIHVGHQPPAALPSYHAMIRSHRHGGGPPPAAGEAADSVVFTSGTTGRPKGAVRDFSSVGAMELLRILERLPMRVGDRHLVVAPLYHSGAQAFTLINTALAATLVLVDRFEAEAVLELLSRERIASTFLVPTMTQRLLDLPAELHARRPTPGLRAIVSGAAPFSDGLRRRAIDRFGADAIFDFYGATELGWVTLVDGHEMLERPGTLGRPLAGQELRVVDERGRPLPPGEVGTIFTRSHQHMRGYLRDEAATREIQREGWVTVEDQGYLDADGYLFLTGRTRDMVITGGVNVYPVEVEHVLSRHPSIRDVAVIGLPDPEWGERLTAVVVPGEGFDVDAVDAWVRGELAKAKRPRRWELVDALPRNPTGKVLKRALRERFGGASA
ncbi:MAG: AMP-binding protein [Myxococcales bacterium]|nr:AMP-binding protein [Myxococcales bacterium]